MLVLTPSQSLADRLRQLSPDPVYSIHSYLLTLWEGCGSSKHLLSEFEEWQLWQDVIAHSSLGPTLDRIPSLAKWLQEAWTLQHEWQLPSFASSLYFSDEVNQFIEWSRAFKALATQKNYLTRGELLSELTHYTQSFTLPDKFLFHSFDRLNPQTQHFFEKLGVPLLVMPAQAGIQIRPTSTCYVFQNFAAECEAMAHWAKAKWQTHPEARIHCVIPGLTTCHAQIERIFRKVFSIPLPDSLPIACTVQRSINQDPRVKLAFLFWRCDRFSNSIDLISQLLLTPLLASAQTESSACALMDCALRALNQPTFTWQEVCFQAQKHGALVWWENLEKALAAHHVERAHKRLPLAEWIAHFKNTLSYLGLSTALFEASFEALSEGYFEKTVTAHQALILLEQHCQINKIKKDEATIHSRITLLDPREAAILPCDFLWIAKLDHEHWPATAKPNPFLPLALQIEHDLPHSSFANEMRFAEQILARLLSVAPEVTLSYAASDSETLHLTTLLKQAGVKTTAMTVKAPEIMQALLQPISEKQGPALTEHNISGGSDVLKAQSNCPFQAFAKYRLKATKPQEVSLSLTASDRGRLLHDILDRLWKQLGNSATLQAYSEQQLSELIEICINNSFNTEKVLLKKCPAHWIAAEKQCLQTLLATWLAFEKTRPPFKVIAQEQKQMVQLGQLSLKLRVDRIDQLNSGETLVIDYKTGQVAPSPKSWEGARPQDPQLPLYCFTLPNIRASLIAHVSAQRPRLIGITAKETGDRWNQLVQSWSAVLHTLAEQFHTGYAAVDPRDHNSCTYCDFPSLCRVGER